MDGPGGPPAVATDGSGGPIIGRTIRTETVRRTSAKPGSDVRKLLVSIARYNPTYMYIGTCMHHHECVVLIYMYRVFAENNR